MISFKGGRQAVSRVTDPIGRALLRIGLTPDMMTVLGTVITVVAAIVLFGNGYLFAGAMVCWAFVMLDMVDGAMARARGWSTRFGAVLDSTCDRIADGAIFGALAGALPDRLLAGGADPIWLSVWRGTPSRCWKASKRRVPMKASRRIMFDQGPASGASAASARA